MYREDLELIERELCQLTEQYSVKCLENAALLERLDAQTRTIHADRLHIHNLLSRSAAKRFGRPPHSLHVKQNSWI